MVALQNYFSELLITLPQDVCIDIVLDNAKGLTKDSASSEQRRKYEARLSSSSRSGKVSRWESELQPVAKTVPQTPQRRESASVNTMALPPSPSGSPQIPRRRSSVDEDYCSYKCESPAAAAAEQEDTSHSRSSQSSNSSRSSRSSGSADYALAPPRRQTSFFSAERIEVNQSVGLEHPSIGKLVPTHHQVHPIDMIVRLDAQIGGSSGSSNKKKKTKGAPKPPRRMKSMEAEDLPESPKNRNKAEGDKLDTKALQDALLGVVGALSKRPSSRHTTAGEWALESQVAI